MRKKIPWRTMMMPDSWYLKLDRGIRFAVRVLHARGFETCQSCQGGRGHCYDQPTIDLNATGDDAWGFAAVAALQDYGIQVMDVSLHWNIRHGLPYDRKWRIQLRQTQVARADERPFFIQGTQAQATT